LHAAPINVATALKKHLFEKIKSVVMTSATLCTAGSAARGKTSHGPEARVTADVSSDTGLRPVQSAQDDSTIDVRQGAYLPHWTKRGAIYAINFRLVDSLPQHVLKAWITDRDAIVQTARTQNRPLATEELQELDRLHSTKVEFYLDSGVGACWLRRSEIASIVRDALEHFNHERY